MSGEPDFRTDRVALKIDALIPELQDLVNLLRETVREINAETPEEENDRE